MGDPHPPRHGPGDRIAGRDHVSRPCAVLEVEEATVRLRDYGVGVDVAAISVAEQPFDPDALLAD